MEFKLYRKLPEGACIVRTAVFMKEQGFKNEFDEIDEKALHGLLTENGNPVGTFRIFPAEEPGVCIFGRLAVMKSCRGKKAGSRLMQEAIAAAKKEGAKEIKLHAQVRAQHFYKTLGFTAYGPIEDEEGVPHQWMKRKI
jgi:predicted GNAT family N-acyltransferase